MTIKGLITLAERIEGATSPDRELDEAIARAVNWCPPKVNAAAWKKHELAKPQYWFSDAFGMPAYTASIDAAMSLVPEGCDWLIRNDADEKFAHVTKDFQPRVVVCGGGHIDMSTGKSFAAYAATPALALAAAAIRAIEAEGKSS